MGFRAICKFTDWLVRPRKEYGPQLRFGPYTFLSLTNQSVNLYIALKPMFYLLNIVRWQSDLVHTIESVLPVCDNPYDMNNGF